MSDMLSSLLTGHGVLLPLGAFMLSGVAVVLIGTRLARHADAIADATGIGRLWIGTVLLAASTSLPELITDVNAATFGVIDIGVGDLIGSTLANMLLLAVLDLTLSRRRILDHVDPQHALIGTLAVTLTLIAGAAIASGGAWGRIGHVGLETILIVIIYVAAVRAVYASSQSTPPSEQLSLGESSRTLLRRGLTGFSLSALGLLIAAPLVVVSAEAVAQESGLTETFVGTLLVGFTTSLPEMAATVAAIRLGALDLAVGNVMGSNAFNMCILLAMDVAYTGGPLLASVSREHVLSAQLAALSISLGILAILARRGQRIGVVRIESVLIAVVYAGAAWLLASGTDG